MVEKEAAASLFDAGAQVVFTGADTPAPADVATAKGKWGITYDYVGSCKVDGCLTAPYWNWGPVYTKIAEGVKAKTYKPGWDYFDAETGGLGLYGFMEGQQLTKGMADLPAEDIQMVKDTLAKMLKGEFNSLRCLHRPDQGQQGQGDRPGRREDGAGRSRPVPARRPWPGMQVLHVLVGRRHLG